MFPEKPALPKRTPAQRMFYRQYLPYILPKVLEHAPVSYLTADMVTENWGQIIPWDTKFANEIVFQSKVFFKQIISPDSSRAYDPAFLEGVIDQIINHLMTYFTRAPHYKNAEKAAREYLFKKMNTENAFLARARVRYDGLLRARERRAVAAKTTSVVDAPRQKRPRIQIEYKLDEFNNLKRMTRVDIEKQK